MTYRLTPQQKAVQQAVREFGEREIRPIAAEYEAEERYPERLRQQAAALDFVAPHVPDKYGGAGLDTISTLLITEELWRADPGVGGAIAAADFGTEMIHEYGEEWMRETWLPAITDGETPIATCISEPAYGSNAAGMSTRAKKEGDGYVVNGEKMWITNGTVADVAIVMAKTNPEAGHRGITALLTETDVQGYEASRIENKLGIRAQDTAEVYLDDLYIPAENVIGKVDQGFYQLMEFLAPARADVAAQATGVAQAALNAAINYAVEREQFGQPIGEFQAIQHKLAEMATNIEAGRALAYRAGAAIDAGDDSLGTQLASMAKLFCSEHAVDVTDEALQVFGGAGYVSDHPVERYYRDARITKIYDGTSEIQKNIIADSLI
jgi:alkylation response protein AidB-like acyl-CoA dehydrogenase